MSGGSNVSGEFDTSGKSNTSLAIDIQDGLCAYACWQAQVYDDLIKLFVGHWRKYLLARSLGTAWLGGYPPPDDPAPAQPSRGYPRSDTGTKRTIKISTKCTTSGAPAAPDDSETDAPLDSEGDDDNDNGDDTPGGTDAKIDAEEMFADDWYLFWGMAPVALNPYPHLQFEGFVPIHLRFYLHPQDKQP